MTLVGCGSSRPTTTSQVESDDGDRPFFTLRKPRTVARAGLPPDLATFCRSHEGIGIEHPPDRFVRMCKLDEVRRVGWKDLHIVGDDVPPDDGWANFAGYRVGYSDMLDEIVWAVSAPG